jgi:pectinesterase
MKPVQLIAIVVLNLAVSFGFSQDISSDYLTMAWKDVATGMPSEWYGSEKAKLVAENVLLSQKEIGGWEKNKSYHHAFTAAEKEHYAKDKSEIGATFDNDATITELRFLAKVHSQTNDNRYKQAFKKGLNYIFTAQYKNGGWPQFFPVRRGSVAYSGHITYNDDAMVNIMEFLKEIISENKEYTSLQITSDTRAKAKEAFDKGIQCFLDTQIIYDGKPSVWCAQHDSVTLAPAKARSYELPSFSGSESVGIVLLLMDIDNPSKEIITSVNGAVQWFENNGIEGIKIDTEIRKDGSKNRIVVEDKNAPTLWGRFYDLETSTIFFCSRDGIERNSLAEISDNRRNGYRWYTNAPEKALNKYHKWLKNLDKTELLEPVKSGVYKWNEHPVKMGELRESRKILEGTSPHFEYLEIHATTQFPGAKPGKAHANQEFEECIIVKEGQMKITIEGKSSILKAGGVILLMPKQMHSIANVGKSNLTYFVMKYKSRKKMNIERGQASGGSLMLNKDSLIFKPSPRGGGISYFDRATAMCERFEMHVTQLNKKGSSHKPHKHVETEIILVLSGETEMIIDGKDYEASAGDFYFMESQLQHGVRNTRDEPCSYFAFKWM